MKKDLTAARRYAQALFEISRDLHKDNEVESELDSLSAALKKMPEIEKFVENPSLKMEQKRALLRRIYQDRPPKAGLPKAGGETPIDEILLNFLTILFEKNRFYLIHDIALNFKKIADEAKGQGVAEIHSATPLKPEAQNHIVQQLEKMAGYRITVQSLVDPALIGGILVKIKNKVIDDTVKNKIFQIKKELTAVQSI